MSGKSELDMRLHVKYDGPEQAHSVPLIPLLPDANSNGGMSAIRFNIW